MELTLILARFWGLVLIISGGALFLNKKLLSDLLRRKDKEEYMLLSGFLALLIGSIHVSVYNFFEVSMRGLITLFGWSALIKGAMRLAYPDISRKAIDTVVKNNALYSALFGVLIFAGLYLLYSGFGG